MKTGEPIFMTRKPVGVFTVENTWGWSDSRWRIYVAAGTGLAPFVGMARRSPARRQGRICRAPCSCTAPRIPTTCATRASSRATPASTACTTSAPSAGLRSARVDRRHRPGRGLLPARASGGPGGPAGARVGWPGPGKAGVLICGLQGTIGQTITRLASRGFVPDNRRIRKALERIPEERAAEVWWEQYDNTPVIDIKESGAGQPAQGQAARGLVRVASHPAAAFPRPPSRSWLPRGHG